MTTARSDLLTLRPPLLALWALALPLGACGPGFNPGIVPGDDDDDTVGDDDDTTFDPPETVTQRSCSVRLRFAEGNPGSVQVAGEWNGWEPEAMEGPDGGGAWRLDVGELAPGDYAHKFLLDGQWEGDPPAWAYAKWLDGTENRALRVGDCNQPLLQAVEANANPAGAASVTVQFARAASGVLIDPSSVSASFGDGAVPAEILVDTESGLITVSASGLPPGKHSLRLRAADVDGVRAENEPLFVPLWVEDEPFEWRDGLMYFAFVDRFRDGDWDQPPLFDPVPWVDTAANYQGGDFLGVIHAMEEGYFEALGVNVLWLTPVYENPDDPFLAADGVHNFSGFHGYWPTEARGVEERFGDFELDSEARLIELIDKAHERGIRVIFDLVLNHVHEQHEYVAAHPEWFGGGCVCGSENCGWDEHAIDCWFMPYLPDLNYRNHAILRQVMEDTLWLAEHFDVDGFRVDAAKHMDHVIMRTLRKRLRDDFERGGGAPFHLVGETFTGGGAQDLLMQYVSEDELNGQFDFPLYWSIRDAFVGGGSFNSLEGEVAAGQAAYGDAPMSAFLGNHDVGRIATAIAGNAAGPWAWSEDLMAGGGDVDQWDIINRISMGFAFTLTQPGLPLIYYGDEIGLAGDADPDNRRLMNFAPYLSPNQDELLARVRVIGQARKASNALRRGQRVQLWVEDDVLVYALDAGGGDVAIVAMNKGSGERTLEVPVGGLGIDGATFEDVTRPRLVNVSGELFTITLGSWDYGVLVR